MTFSARVRLTIVRRLVLHHRHGNWLNTVVEQGEGLGLPLVQHFEVCFG